MHKKLCTATKYPSLKETFMDILPESNDEYGTKQYWNQRYAQEANGASFDWFKSYSEIADILRNLIPDKHSKILMLGCGNSKLSQDMYDDGYSNIVNTDYSTIVIEKMKERHEELRPEMEWHEMDVRDLKFDDNSFDVAIDKGTMDAMMTVKGDIWVCEMIFVTCSHLMHSALQNTQNPPQQVVDDCTKEVNEVIRTLRKGTGVFIYLTFGQPHFRKRYLTVPGTTLETRELGEAFHYYLYILRT
ncbi:S-adenosyl-L-methionine-dependent methyltransferase [Lentinula detonsa]|uniref:S-adenosyl-L-methionine-dependent methyltransferase n=1 Tax=Lentinula detonsa TaxID=2804962 RepID=A0A9W8P2H2_9AGAR|nr:S-adenosyl-L-methionine-dependent methyltransferase [Lentinula detonsa]